MGHILVVGKDQALVDALRRSVTLKSHTVDSTRSALEAMQIIRGAAIDVLVTDPARRVTEAMAFVDEVNRLRPGVRTILLAPDMTDADVVSALRAQVFACFTAPADPALALE